MEEIEFTRTELYDLVWSEPLSRLARKYNISDNGLRKICKKHHIPLPVMGHWQKVQYGYKVTKTKLPENSKSTGKIMLCYRDENGKYVYPGKLRKAALKEVLINNPDLPVKVSGRLTNPDPLVVQAQNTLLSGKFHSRIHNSIVTTSSGELRISVTPQNIPRALRFMDAFIKLLYARNHQIVQKYGRIYGKIQDVTFEFSIRETYLIIPAKEKYSSREYTPSGALAFMSGPLGTKEWKDGKKPIEERLPDIMIYIEMKAKELSDAWAENERRRQSEAEQERLLKERIAKKQAELNAVKNLISQANSWKQTIIIREYLTAVERLQDLTDQGKEWLEWARKKAEWFDPLTQAKDEILDDHDRNSLIEELT